MPPTKGTTYADVEAAFDTAHATLKAAVEDDPSDGNYTDLAGLLRLESSWAANEKRALVSEVPPGAATEGEVYRLYQNEVTQRTFSTDRLLMDFLFHADAGVGFVDLIRELIEAKVMKLTWNFTNVKDYAYRKHVTLITAPHAIDDLDTEHHIGEVKKLGSAEFTPVKDTPSK